MSEQRNAERDREIIAAATKGPWEVVNTGDISIAKNYRYTGGLHLAQWIAEMDFQEDDEEEQVYADARFIAHARQAFPHWLERAVSAEQRVAELEKENRRLAGIEQALKDFEQPNGTATDVFMWLESTTNYDHNIDKALKGVE